MGLFRRKEKEPEALCSAVIVAAGSSSRMGLDKLLAEVGGLPVLVYKPKTRPPVLRV